jgi:hypothetical protein
VGWPPLAAARAEGAERGFLAAVGGGPSGSPVSDPEAARVSADGPEADIVNKLDDAITSYKFCDQLPVLEGVKQEHNEQTTKHQLMLCVL